MAEGRKQTAGRPAAALLAGRLRAIMVIGSITRVGRHGLPAGGSVQEPPRVSRLRHSPRGAVGDPHGDRGRRPDRAGEPRPTDLGFGVFLVFATAGAVTVVIAFQTGRF